MDDFNSTPSTPEDNHGLPDYIDQSQIHQNFGLNQEQYQNGTYYQQPKKKSFAKIIAIVAVFVILVSGATTAYAFRGKLINTFAQLTQSPADYYAFIEKGNLNVSKQYIKKYMDASTGDMGEKIKTDVNLNRDNINSLMKDNLGESLEDFEKQLGLPIKSFGFNMLYGHKGDILNESFGLRFNQVDIITAQLFLNSTKGDYFIKFPELSDAFLDFSDVLNEEEGVNIKDFKAPTSDQTIDLINRYSLLVINDLTDVELDKDSELKIDNLAKKCSKLKVKISNDNLYDILKDILKEAKNDEYILNLLSVYNVSKKDYQDGIEDQLDNLDKSSDKLLEDDIIMEVYVDDNGAIIGRSFSSEDTGKVFSYAYLNNNSKSEYNLNISDGEGNTVFDLTGNQTKVGQAYDGSAEIEITDPTGEEFDELNIDIDYKDFRTYFLDNHLYRTGTFTLSSADLLGVEITSESTVEDNTQKNVITVQAGGKTLASIDTTSEYLKDYKAEMPSENAKTYDYSDMDSYTSSLNLDAYIEKLSERLGVNLQSIIDNIENSYNDYTDYDYDDDYDYSDDEYNDDEYIDDYDFSDDYDDDSSY